MFDDQLGITRTSDGNLRTMMNGKPKDLIMMLAMLNVEVLRNVSPDQADFIEVYKELQETTIKFYLTRIKEIADAEEEKKK